MPIQTIVLGSILVVAMIYIAVQHLTHWLERQGVADAHHHRSGEGDGILTAGFQPSRGELRSREE